MKRVQVRKVHVCLMLVVLLVMTLIVAGGCGFAIGVWTDTGGRVSNYGITSLAYDSAHSVLYAGCEQVVEPTGYTAGRGVWKYDGNFWTDTGGGISNYHIQSLACDGEHNLLYAGCYKFSPGEGMEPHAAGVWKYNGTTWTDISGSLKRYLVHALGCDSVHNILYASFEYSPSTVGVRKYDGKRWTDIGGDISKNYGIVSFAYDGEHNVLYAGAYGGVLKYTGTEWIDTGLGKSSWWVNCIAYDSVHKLLYAGAGPPTADIVTFGHSVWKYDGTSWTDAGGSVSSYTVYSLACDSTHNLVYASCSQEASSKGIWKYDGTRWTNISDKKMSNYYFRPLVYDSKNNILYAGVSDEMHTGKGVWKYKVR